MRNPINVIVNYLRGEDLKHSAPETKSFTWSDPGALITPPTVITSGPGQWMMAAPGYPNADGNSAVWACLLQLSNAHIEPPLRVWKGDPETTQVPPEWLSSSPLQQLLTKPNPSLTNLELWFWTSWAKHTDGNAYLRKIRSGNERTGNVVELWPLSPTKVKPITAANSTNFIDAYRYTYAPSKWEDIPPENIVHFKLGIDDQDMRLGLAPIKRLVREIASDSSATQFTDALLRNFGFSPDQLNLKELHDVPETRICAVMGVPPVIAGLSAGLSQSQNYASMRQIRENFTELSIVPIWRMDQATFNAQLKPDFTDEDDVLVAYDLKKVRALQEDRTELFTRLDNAVKTGWVLPNEARAEVGLEPMDGGNEPLQPKLPAGPITQPTANTPPALPDGQKEHVISFKAGEMTADALQ